MLTKKKLGHAIGKAIEIKGVSKADIARRFGVKPPSVTGWIQKGSIDKDRLMELIEYFSDVVGPDHWGMENNILQFPSLEKDKDLIEIPRLNVAGSMGTGRLAPEGYVDVIDRLSVNKDYLSRTVAYSSASNLAIITGFGDSMEGTYSDGDLLLVDRGVTEIKIDAVYVVLYQGELFIKRFQRRPGEPMLMISDNKSYPPIKIKNATANGLEILGRVLIAWNAKKL